jgi:hypothetical protein
MLDRCDTASVPTDIYFAAENVLVTVDEDPGQVAEAFTANDGLPFRLTGSRHRGEVYVNPATVAFWSASGSDPVPAPPEEPPRPTKERDAVTDIWGKPLRRKPRR